MSQSATPDQKLNPVFYVIIGLLVVGIVIVAGFIVITGLTDNTPLASDVNDTADGVARKDPPLVVSDFTLTGQDGEPVSLSDFQGKPTLISFGFTHCPDVCPLTLNEMRRIHDELGEQGDDVNFVFISVDGSRDTPEILRDYFEVRNVTGIVTGMTGEEADLRRLGVDYGLRFSYGEPDDSGNYNVDHTAGMFLLDADNRWVAKYAFMTEMDVIVSDLQDMLSSRT